MPISAMEFFQLSAGKWLSQRVTHHLAFRQVETGESEIQVETLASGHAKVVELCELHKVDPKLASGGAIVAWQATMAWDNEDANHKGSTVMVIVPDVDNPRQGQLLREKGYAEIVPVAGRYVLDEEDAMILITEYETMSSTERFWFPSPDLRMRSSTVKRFGGFSTASLCTEVRSGLEQRDQAEEAQVSSGDRSQSILGW